MSLSKTSIFSVIWEFSGRMLKQGSQFVVSIILTRLLTPEDYGLIGMVMVIIAILNFIIESGLSQLLVQKKYVSQSYFNTLFTINLILGTFLFASVNLLATQISKFYNYPELVNVLYVLSFLIPIYSLTIVHEVKLKRELNFKIIGIATFVSTLIGGVFGIFLALQGFGVWSLVVQILVTGLTALVVKWRHSGLRVSVQIDTQAIKEFFAKGKGYFLTSFFIKLNDRIDVFIIGKITSATTLGFFTRAKSFKNLIILNSSTTVNSVLFPLLSKIQNDDERYLKYLTFSYQTVLIFSAALTGLLLIGSTEFFLLLFGKKWLPAVPMFNYLCLAGFFISVSRIYYNVLRSKGLSNLLAKINFSEVIINILIFVSWIYLDFSLELLLGLLVGQSVVVYLFYFIFTNIHIKWNVWNQIKPFLLDVGICIIAYFLSIWISDESHGFSKIFYYSAMVLLYIGIFKIKLFKTIFTSLR